MFCPICKENTWVESAPFPSKQYGQFCICASCGVVFHKDTKSIVATIEKEVKENTWLADYLQKKDERDKLPVIRSNFSDSSPLLPVSKSEQTKPIPGIIKRKILDE